MKKINKKGYIYVITTSFLITIVFVLLLIQNYNYQEKQESESRRIKIMNDFVKGFNQDMERAINIASFRALIAIEDHIASTGKFIDNVETYFSEAVYNGTINETQILIMRNSSIKDYLEKTNNIASSFGMKMNATISNITITQKDAWNVEVSIEATINITDNTNLATWQYKENFSSKIPILNLRDPLYTVYTNNRLPNAIRKYPNETLVTTNNDTTNLVEFLEKMYYIESTNAPNFIQRFTNNITPSLYGIESVVDILSISDQDIIVYQNRIKTDYIYFNNIIDSKACDFDDTLIPETLNFVIPVNRLNLYQVANISHSTSCPT